MSNLTITTTNLEDEGLDFETVNLGTSNLTTSAVTNLGESNLEVGVGGSMAVDNTLSYTSENPVQNKIITEALSGKASLSHTHALSDVTDFDTHALSNLEIEAMLN